MDEFEAAFGAQPASSAPVADMGENPFGGDGGGDFGGAPGGDFGGAPGGDFGGAPGGDFGGAPGGDFGGAPGGDFGGAPVAMPAEPMGNEMFGAPMDAAPPPPEAGGFVEGGEFTDMTGNGGDLMGNGSEVMGNGGFEEAHMLAPEGAPPAMLDAFGAEAPPAAPADVNNYMFSEPTSAQEVWAKQQYELLQAKEAEEAVAKEQLKKKAGEQKEELYAMREKEMEAKRKTNRENEQMTEYTPSSGSLWENVHSLVDMTSKVSEGKTDLTRMRQLFIKLKHGAQVQAA